MYCINTKATKDR